MVVLFLHFCSHYDLRIYLQCTEETHRPVDCGTVSKWILKNSAESENMNWYAISEFVILSFCLLYYLV